MLSRVWTRVLTDPIEQQASFVFQWAHAMWSPDTGAGLRPASACRDEQAGTGGFAMLGRLSQPGNALLVAALARGAEVMVAPRPLMIGV